MVSLVHKFVNAVADDPTHPEEVRPSNWNDSHALSGGVNGQLLFDFNGAPSETTSPVVVGSGSGLTFTGPSITNTTGSELVTDGNFATDPASHGWTLNDNTWSAGQISGTLVDVTTGDVAVTIPVTLAADTWYVVEIHVTMVGGDTPDVYFDTHAVSGYASGLPLAGAQVYKFPIYSTVSGSNHLNVDFNYYLFAGSSWTLTFVSMKQMATPLPSPQLQITNFAGKVALNSGGLEYGDTILLGQDALKTKSPGGDTIGIGAYAGASLITEYRNIAIGPFAMALAVGGTYSIGIGQGALVQNGAKFNTALGSESLYTNTTGTNNTAVGPNTLYSCSSGSHNVAVGVAALQNLTTGSNNIAIGEVAGFDNLVTGDGNILIGYDVSAPGDDSDYLNIGSVLIGNMSTGPITCTVSWVFTAIQKAGIPANTDITAGQAAVFKDTSGGGVYLAYNDGGTIKKVALT